MGWKLNFENRELDFKTLDGQVALIGAGVAGLTAAVALTRNFQKAESSSARQVRIFDKGRGLGGRIATRRLFGGVLDHGALELHDLELLKCALPLKGLSDLSQATHLIQGDRAQRGLYHPMGQTQWLKTVVKEIATELQGSEIHLARKVESLQWSNTDSAYRAVLITCPFPQLVELIERSRHLIPPTALTEIDAALSSFTGKIEYDPCLVSLMRLPTSIAPDWVRSNCKVIRAARFPLSQTHYGLTVQWCSETSKKYFNSSEEELVHWTRTQIAESVPALTPEVQAQIAGLEIEIKKWRYATVRSWATQPTGETPVMAVKLASGLWAAGDGFAGPSAGLAAMSGLAAAEKLIAELSGQNPKGAPE